VLEFAGKERYRVIRQIGEGRLLGGEAGEELVAEADAGFAERGVVDPAAMTRVFVPGFPD